MGQAADEVTGQPARPTHETAYGPSGERLHTDAPAQPYVTRADAADFTPAGDDEPTAEELQIRAEMERTRREMSQTIDAIQDRLDPEDLKEQAKDLAQEVADQVSSQLKETLHDAADQAKDVAREVTEQVTAHLKETLSEAADQAKVSLRRATIGRVEELVDSASDTMRGANTSMLERIRHNPLPSALVGLGLSWLFLGGSDDRERRRYEGRRYQERYGERTRYPYRGAYAGMGDTYGVPSGTFEHEHDEGMMHTAQRKLGDAADTVGDQAGHLASNARDMAGSAGETAMDAGSGFVDTIRENPLPAALAGIGLTWLFMNRSGRGSRRMDWDTADTYGYRRPFSGVDEDRGERGFTGQVANGVGHATDRVGDLASTAGERVGDLTSTATERVSDLAGDVGDRVSSWASDVGDLAGEAGHRVRHAPGSLEQMIQDNPIGMGALGLALGAAVGLALPTTEREQELMGETRDQFMERAQGMMQETKEKVQQVVEEVGSTASHEAQKQGLTQPAR